MLIRIVAEVFLRLRAKAHKKRLEALFKQPEMSKRPTLVAYYKLTKELPMTLALARYTLWSTDGKYPLEISEVRYLDCPEDVERLQDDVMAASHTGIDALIMTPEEPELFPAIEAVLSS